MVDYSRILHSLASSVVNGTKQGLLAEELASCIQSGMKPGDSLPSVNTLSQKLGISRDTVFKAYGELKRRGQVDSTRAKGYYVSKETRRVLLMLDFYSPFKDVLYREFEKQLGEGYTIDLVFHHYNQKLFDTVILERRERYNHYLVMNPDTSHFSLCKALCRIPPEKLLLLDIPVAHWHHMESQRYSYVWQDFDEAAYRSLVTVVHRIRQYRQFILLNPDRIRHPDVTTNAFNRFCSDHGIQGIVQDSSSQLSPRVGDAYFVMRQEDLATLLKLFREHGLRLGADAGILAYNDTPLYEFVANGITVISTDFGQMGRLAARYVKERKPVKEIVPTTIKLRNSL